jgi:hypothetical protein
MTQKTIPQLIKDIHSKLDYIIEILRDDTLRYPGHETYLESLTDEDHPRKSRPNK